jgi:hypothetical protein
MLDHVPSGSDFDGVGRGLVGTPLRSRTLTAIIDDATLFGRSLQRPAADATNPVVPLESHHLLSHEGVHLTTSGHLIDPHGVVSVTG